MKTANNGTTRISVFQRLLTWLSAVPNNLQKRIRCLGQHSDPDGEEELPKLSVEETQPDARTASSTVRPWL
ncbi:hypothetical protein AGOR_G00150290 [Albula goreensis]|uniref:Uncharacterized protein n=1 Tax=Albula goreensis TaxID=1534307 RepID=A0A8T3D7E4_9TELE|nr:hypothetical protein AGOR_G00150290 [Albula goreensis]